MEVGDDVALPAPDESCPGSLRHFKQIERPGVTLHRPVRDKHDGSRRPLEDRDGRLFI
jgi:hypothetical protein